MAQDKKDLNSQHDNEFDLGSLYTTISNLFVKIGLGFKALFNGIAGIFLGILLLIKRNLIWLALSAVVGFGLGLYQNMDTGPYFENDMVIKTQYLSSRQLYQKIAYFNTLIGEREIPLLAKTFHLTPKEAESLMSFKIDNIQGKAQVAELYREVYLANRRWYRSDSSWPSIIAFRDYADNMEKFDYPVQTVKLFSRDAYLYPKVQKGIVEAMQQNEYLNKAKENKLKILGQEETLINKSLLSIDSMRMAINKKLESGGSASGGTLTISQQPTRAAEVELYDKEMMLKNDLMQLKMEQQQQNDIVQVLVDFNAVGTRVNNIETKPYVKYTWMMVLITFVVIIMINFYKKLSVLEKKQISAKKNTGGNL